ncbi:MAG: Sec-independent protein translocase protein TatB [Steroidobacterales bacterium]
MFEGRFSEILIIFVLALIVLGPEKLPRVVSEVGRWVGRARAMARQFREQLEEEVQLEEARKAQRAAAPQTAAPSPTPTDPVPPHADQPAPVSEAAPAADPPLPPTFSHAHPTDATGADTTIRPDAHLRPDEPGT